MLVVLTMELFMRITPVILAAGEGTRMKSTMPKVLHPILGRPMIKYVLQSVRQVTDSPPLIVVGQDNEAIRDAVGDSAVFVTQAERLGTGHAVMQAKSLLRGQTDLVLVLYADMPLLTGDTLQLLIDAQRDHDGPITMLTNLAEDPRGFGRILRNENGKVQAIVEEAQATPQQLKIRELNTGVYCIDADWLWDALIRIPLSPKGEYYLTDLAEIAVSDQLNVQSVTLEAAEETIGINTRIHLAEASACMQRRINNGLMLSGVTMIDPASTFIEPGIKIGQDTVIWPNTYLHGSTQIGEGCNIGPNTIIRDTQIGNGCKVLASLLEGALLEDKVEMGPFARLRKGAHLAEGVHMGNFGEVKNSYLGPGTKMGHFSYMGDAILGPNVNIGAGTITCNYDGKQKYKTTIGADAFIGSDTMLVAPVNLGEGAQTGAGSVVTKDVPAHTLAVGMPARAIRKLER
jgi:bifunctional UDP-N-acetylglucosamine pyrophosphorylase/glucosamine-1-phosphate N-acetyltransferase